MNVGMDVHSILWYSAGMPRERVERVNRHYALRLSVAQELERLAAEAGESETATLEALITAAGLIGRPVPQVTTITTTDGREVSQYIDGRLAPFSVPAFAIQVTADPEAEQTACDELEYEAAAALADERAQRKAARKARKQEPTSTLDAVANPAGSQVGKASVETFTRPIGTERLASEALPARPHNFHSGTNPIAGCGECAEMAGKK